MNLLNGVGILKPQPIISPINENPQIVEKKPYRQIIKEGLRNWGVEPNDEVLSSYEEAMNKYPIYKQFPFLLPAMSVLETGGGKKTKQKFNILNWGINLPPGYFTPQSEREVIGKAASGIAERMAPYQTFRESKDLLDLANVYAPESDNPGTGGKYYRDNLLKVMEIFQNLQ